MSLNVRVITPDKVVWDAMADELILPSSTGQIGILSDHAPLLTALDIGVMRLKTDAGWTSIVLLEGFAEVENNKVTILLELVVDLAIRIFQPLSDKAIVASLNRYGLSIASISIHTINPDTFVDAQDTSIILSPLSGLISTFKLSDI